MSIAHYRFLYGSGSVWKSLFIMQYLWTPPLIYLSPAFPCRWWHGSLVSYGVKISPSHDKHRKHSLITVLFPSPVQVVQFSARPITAANRPSSPTIPVCCTDSAKPYIPDRNLWSLILVTNLFLLFWKSIRILEI